MSLKLYIDENVRKALTDALRRRGVDVLTVEENQRRGDDDAAVLDRAAALGRVVFTNDADFVAETASRQRGGHPFAGVLFAEQNLPIALHLDDLELIAKACEPDEYRDRLQYLPLR